MKPFRWNLQKREQLGRLVQVDPPEVYSDFFHDLRECAARCLASVGDARLVFLGRSPELVFDYLSGALQQTSWSRRLELINLSLRLVWPPQQAQPWLEDDEIIPINARQLLRRQLSEHDLTPEGIASGQPETAFLDLVSSGWTFEAFVEELERWARDEGLDVAAVRRKVRIVGVTWREKSSPKTWRWHQHRPWLQTYPRIKVKNVSVPGELWDALGNTQPKVTPSHPPWRWGKPETLHPVHAREHLAALAQAVTVYDAARTREERFVFSAMLSQQTAVREGWLRSLVGEIRGQA